jgi:predicted  nucleic acid-binding Zn-ribbon protein
MTAPADILREIHRLRRHARELQNRIDQAPRQLKAYQGKADREHAALQGAQDTVKKRKVAQHEKEVSLKSAEAQIAKYEKQINDVTSRKEYDALRAEIAHAKQGVRKIEDEILEAMANVEEGTRSIPELEKKWKEAQAEVAKFEADNKGRQGELASQREQALKELAEVEATLPGDARAVYDRMVQGRNDDAFAAVGNRTCKGCFTELTSQGYLELSQGKFVLCKACGRMIYLLE